jgi:hypothetical protein
VQRPAVSVKADDYRGDRSVAYQHNSEEDYRRDGYRARQHSGRFADYQYDRRGHFSYWDDEDYSWKHDRNHRYNCDRSDRDSDRHDHDSNRSDRNRGCDSQ